MVVLVVGLMLAAASPIAGRLTAICEVGSIAVRDLPNINGNKHFDAYYAAVDPNGHDLLTICPRIRTKIPKGYPIADKDARARAAVHGPISGRYVREAFIYSVGIPNISSDMKSAIVRFSYLCTGLCGGELEARYVRTSKGWQREGAIHTLAVS